MWFFYAAISCLSTSISNICTKSALGTTDPKLLGWFRMLLGLVVVVPVAIYLEEWPTFDREYILALSVSASLNVVALIWVMKAMKLSDLSLVVPLLCLLPGGVMVVSFLINNEVPNTYGILGVLVTIVGTYMLSINKGGGLLAPFRALLVERGPRYMLGVVMVWSFSSSMDKIGITHSSPIIWTVSLYVAIFAGLTLILAGKLKGALDGGLPWKSIAGVGLFTGVADMAQMAAFAIAPLAYVSAVRQSASLFTVLLGVVVFKEQGFSQRIAGATVMMLGVCMLSFL